MKNLFLLFSLCILFTSCSSAVSLQLFQEGKTLEADQKVAFLEEQHQVPDGATKIGKAKFGDTGFSVNCSYNYNANKAVELARKNGANIVKVIKKKRPNFWTTCYRIEVLFYNYDGNVAIIPQYQIQ